MSRPVIIIGAGGHASVLLDIMVLQGIEVLAVVSPEEVLGRAEFAPFKHLRSDDDVLSYSPKDVWLVNGIGGQPGSDIRRRIFTYFNALGYQFLTLVSDRAFVSPSVVLGEGVQVITNAVIHSGTVVGDNVIINTGAIVDHDCTIGHHNHIAPAAVLNGGVVTNERVHVGTGANVLQNTEVGSRTIVGAGAVVSRTVGSQVLIRPAKTRTKELLE